MVGFLLLNLLFLSVYAAEYDLRIGAWNIQKFGEKKMSNTAIVKVIVEVIQRYDLILIQEVLDKDEIYIKRLLNEVNRGVTRQYNIVDSEPLGTTRYKERYAFFYRMSMVAVRKKYQWPKNFKQFERSPYIVQFHILKSDFPDFGFIPLHAKPEKGYTKDEIDRLVDVYKNMKADWKIQNFVIGGDLNADCNYTKKNEEESSSLLNNPKIFQLLISRGSNTRTSTVGDKCAYDRLVIAGHNLQRQTIKAAPYYFFDELRPPLDQTFAKNVSDHVPVEMELRIQVVEVKDTSTSYKTYGQFLYDYISETLTSVFDTGMSLVSPGHHNHSGEL